MPRLTKTQIYAIRWLNHDNISHANIATELGLNIEQVKKTLEKYTSTNNNIKINTKTSPVGIINKTTGKGIGGVTIMTQDASMAGDIKNNPVVKKNG